MPGRSNSFDGVRLVAALAVLVGHGFILTGVRPVPAIGGIPIDALAVSVFFVVSGYLITGSWNNLRSTRRFLQHRFLRIFPALWVVVIVTVLVVGPLASSLGPSRYFSSGQTWLYLLNLSTDAQYLLPGVFTSTAHSRIAVNGSLWTLGVEVACYLSVLAIGLALRRHQSAGFAGMTIVAVAIYFLTVGTPALLGVSNAAPVVVFFGIGGLLRATAPRSFFQARIAVPLLAVWLVAAAVWPVVSLELEWIALPYCILTVALASIPILRSAARFGDLSYGTYLWAFVIQQVEIDLVGSSIPLWLDLVIVGCATLAVAWLSWHLVERRCLAAKDRGPLVRGLLPSAHPFTAT